MYRTSLKVFFWLSLFSFPFLLSAQYWNWVRTQQGPSTDLVRGVAVDAHGQVYLAGVFEQHLILGLDTLQSAGSADGFLCKYSPKGHLLWARRFGGASLDRVMGMKLSMQGEILLTGGFSSQMVIGSDTLTSSNRDVFVAKFDSMGQGVWGKAFGGNSSDFGQALAVDPSGNVLVTGTFRSDSLQLGPQTLYKSGSSDFFLFKLNNQGQALWARQARASLPSVGNALATDSSGTVYVTGSFQGTAFPSPHSLSSLGRADAFLACYAPNGQLRWTRQAGGPGFDIGQTLVTTADGLFLAGRHSDSLQLGNTRLGHAGSYDMFLASYDRQGGLQWAHAWGGSGREEAWGLAAGPHGDAYLTGSFSQSLQLDSLSLSGVGGEDLFVAKINPMGSIRWLIGAGGTDDEQGYTLAKGPGSSLYLGGSFRGAALFDGFPYYASGRDDAFLARLRDWDTVFIPPLTSFLLDGQVFVEDRQNCLPDPGELGLGRWWVKAEPGSHYRLTDQAGRFAFDLPQGSYQIEPLPPLDLSDAFRSHCGQPQYASLGVGLPGPGPMGLNFGQLAQKEVHLQLSMFSSGFFPCQPGRLFVHYLNPGAFEASGVKVWLDIPEEVSLLGSSLAYSRDQQNRLWFDLGRLPAQAKGTLVLDYRLACSTQARVGQSFMLDAEIICDQQPLPHPLWSGAELSAQAHCLGGDSVQLLIQNIGKADMRDSVKLQVFLDDERCSQRYLQLAAGDSLLGVVFSKGKTVRLELEQVAHHPRMRWLSVSREACGQATGYPSSLGFVNHFPQWDEGAPAHARLSEVIRRSRPVLHWQVLPVGRGPQHSISPGSRLYFELHYTQTNPLAFDPISLVDTLSPYLDLQSLRWEGSSHPLSLEVSGQGQPVLHWRLENDTLRMGESLSLRYSARLRDNLPPHLRITHQAYLSDSTFTQATSAITHTLRPYTFGSNCKGGLIWGPFPDPTPQDTVVTTSLHKDLRPEDFSLFPNPTTDLLHIRWPESLAVQSLKLWSPQGQLLQDREASGKAHEVLDLRGYPEGLYGLEVKGRNSRLWLKVMRK
jgi:hypothetical protein